MEEEFEMTPFGFVRKICSISGIWPLLTPSQRYIGALLMSASLFLAYFVQVLNLLSNEITMRSSMFYAPYLFSTICIYIVYYSGLHDKKLLLRLLLEIMNDWSNIKKTKQFVVLLDYAFLSRKCIFMLTFTYNLYMLLTFLLSLKPILLDMVIPLNKTRPHTLIIPMNWYTEEEKYFSKILLLQYLICIAVGLCVISSLSVYLIILQHICAMFQITGCLLDNIMDDKEKELKVINDEVIYSRMIHIIQIHKRTIEYTDVLNDQCNIRLLVMMMCAIGFIGIAIIPIMELLNEDMSKTNMGLFALPIFFVVCHLIWIFVFCTVGQHLQNLSETIFYKGYETPWYLFSKKTQRLLYFIIARADKPNYVSIGQMFVASHEFFAGLARLSISYGMVLHSVR